jgi:hypothetical protein
MALTRAQLLAGDSSQGDVLLGQVQAVKEGAGIFIDTDGTISVDVSGINSVVKTNNNSAYNGYIWPNSPGGVNTFLKTDGTGILGWVDLTTQFVALNASNAYNSYIWPNSDGSAGNLLSTDGSGNLSWVSGGFVALNQAGAYNSYVWPLAAPTGDLFLKTDAAGALSWATAGVIVDSSAPTSPTEGMLWFDCSTGTLNTYESCTTGFGQWTPASQPGLPVIPASTLLSPPAASGSGTLADPYIFSTTTVGAGSGGVIVTSATITGLAPNQYVPIVDLSAAVNGGRFTASNYYANGLGTLQFDLIFTDNPVSPPSTTYTANIRVGYSSVYINAPVNVTAALVINNPGTITGTPQPNEDLTYNVGSASGGTPTYTYSWDWLLGSDASVLQTGGTAYTIPSSILGDTVYVALTVDDSGGLSDTAFTSPTAPIARPPFPNPTPPTIPTTTTGTNTFTWDGASTTLEATGCLEFQVNGAGFDQGPTAVDPADTVQTRWISSPSCAGATNGVTITGALEDADYSAGSSITIDRLPATFTINSVNTNPNQVVTSAPVTPSGYNSTGYVTGIIDTAGATNLLASVGGGTFVSVPASGNTLPINPGQTLEVRFTVGSTPISYSSTINIGEGSSFTSAIFTAAASAYPALTQNTASSISGTANVGQTLTMVPGTASGGFGTVSYTYRWEVSDDGVSGWSTISGATTTSYLLTSSEGNKYVRGVTVATDSATPVQTLNLPSNVLGPVQVNVAPVVDSVSIGTRTPGGSRFTSQTFPLTVSISQDGVPASTKGMKAYVDGTLVTKATTAAITNVGSLGTVLTSPSAWTTVSENYNLYYFQARGNNKWWLFYFDPGNPSTPRDASIRLAYKTGINNPSDTTLATWTDMKNTTLSPNDSTASLIGYGEEWALWWFRDNGNNPRICRATSGGTSFVEDQPGNVKIFANTGRATVSTCLFGQTSGSSLNSWIQRYVNGVFSASSTTQAALFYSGSGGGSVANTAAIYKTSQIWVAANFRSNGDSNYYEVSTNDGVSFTSITSLGYPSVPVSSPNAIYEIGGELWLVKYADLKAYITSDFQNWRQQTIGLNSKTGTLGGYYGWGFWDGPRFMVGSGSYDSWVCLDGVNWSQIYSNATAQQGPSWSTVTPTGQDYNIKPCITSPGPFGSMAIATNPQTTITFSSNQSLNNFSPTENITELNSDGSAGDATGQVVSTNTGTNTMVLANASGTFTIGSFLQGPLKTISNTRLYLTLNNTGNVTNMQSADPGFLTQTGTPSQLVFPATFPSGQTPDTELPAGTSLTVAVNATNASGTSSAVSSPVTPT